MSFSAKHALLYLGAAAFLALAVALIPRTQPDDWRAYQQKYLDQTGHPRAVAVQPIFPRLNALGQPAANPTPELCLTCHLGLEEISPSHPVESFGCVICHRGVGVALDKTQAHAGLLPNPADLSVAGQTCGQSGCHAGHPDPTRNHIDQVNRSLQATYAGAIALIRYTFGAQSGLEPAFGMLAGVDPHPLPHTAATLAAYVPGPNALPAEQQFAQNCLDGGCHLTQSPTLMTAPYFYRATGCAACHVLYNDDGLYRGNDPTLSRAEPGHLSTHQFTTAMPYTQCNHCHNRGNYNLRSMSFVPRPDLPPAGPPIPATMPAEGRRLKEYYQPIGQFTQCEWELDCIDCHTQAEAMGDGHFWPNQQEMQYTQCRTCHGTLTQPPATAVITNVDDPALRLARLNGHYPLAVGDEVIITDRGEKMGSVQMRNGQLIQYGKVDGRKYTVPPVMGTACGQKSDEQESHYCHHCHAVQR